MFVAGRSAPQADAVTVADAWSRERVNILRQQDRAVLVNFTAAWCITCKVNEQVALTTEAVREAMKERGVAYLKGDWTRRDPAITEELRRYGRSGVPLYLLYPAGQGSPRVLPQLLTESLVLQVLSEIDAI
jgi:thiol:disulfide interchange protein DsbD